MLSEKTTTTKKKKKQKKKKKNGHCDIASYAPIIESEVADMAPVYTTMREETAVTFGQSHAI